MICLFGSGMLLYPCGVFSSPLFEAQCSREDSYTYADLGHLRCRIGVEWTSIMGGELKSSPTFDSDVRCFRGNYHCFRVLVATWQVGSRLRLRLLYSVHHLEMVEDAFVLEPLLATSDTHPASSLPLP